MVVKIRDSYKVKDLKAIREQVEFYYLHSRLSHNRTVDSYVREWFVHNWLYQHNLFVEHTKDVDFESDINPIIEFCYWVIFKLFS